MKGVSQSFVKKLMNKRVLTLAAVCLLLAGAVTANLILSNKDKSDAQAAAAAGDEGTTQVLAQDASAQTGFFDLYREERDNVRTQELAYLDSIVAQATDETTLADAQKQKLELVNNMEMEVTIENLVRAKGFDEVIVSLHAGSVNVIVGEAELTDEQVAQILDIVLRETGEKAENVKVSTAE